MPLLLDMNEIKSLTVYKVCKVFFLSGFRLYACIGTHIQTFSIFFFICCKVLSPFFILTLLDHVVLVSSASTTNTREIKNRFRLERRSPSRSTKIVNTNKRLDFFGFSHVFLIFCLWFFVYCFSLLSLIGFFLISIRKSTITYI